MVGTEIGGSHCANARLLSFLQTSSSPRTLLHRLQTAELLEMSQAGKKNKQ
jgi:hypothetical protein